MPTVSIVIEGDASGAAEAIDQVNQRAAALPPVFSQAGAASDEATARITSGFTRGKEAAALLSEETGVTIPRALRGILADSALIGPALQAAFGATAIVAFAEVVVHATEAIAKLVTGEKEAEEAAKALQEAHTESLDALQKYAAEANSFQLELAAVGLKGSDALRAEGDVAALVAAQMHAHLADLQAMKSAAQQLLDTDTQSYAASKQATIFSSGMPQISPQMQSDKASLDAITASINKYNVGVEQADNALTLFQEREKAAYGDEQVESVKKLTDAENELMNKSIQASDDYYKQLAEQATKQNDAENELMNKSIQASDEYYKQLAEEAKQENDYDSKLMNDSIQASDEYYKQLGEQANKYAETWTRARNTMASQLDSFFSELTSGNIAQTFLKQFEKMVSQMVATWMMGIQGMQGAVTRSGGLFGTLMGDFGGGGGGGGFFGGGESPVSTAIPGIDPSFMNGSDMSGLLSGSTGPAASMALPMSAGGGALSAILPAGARSGFAGMVGAGGGGGLLSMLGSLLPIGALAGGSALMGSSNPIAAMLGMGGVGFGAGAVAGPMLTSFAESGFLSGTLGLGTASLLSTVGSFLGPIGAGIGLISGLIGLFTGNGKLKTQQANLQNQELIALTNLENAFSLHQIDYNSAISQAEQIRQSYTQQQEALQQGGSVGRVDAVVNDAEQNINNIEQQRQNVVGAVGNYGPAQFEKGGFVHPSLAGNIPAGFQPAMHFAMGGAVPAIVHTGEYVLNASAVQRTGRAALDAMNAGSGGGGDIHIYANDAKSFEEMLNSHDHRRALVRTLQRFRREGYM